MSFSIKMRFFDICMSSFWDINLKSVMEKRYKNIAIQYVHDISHEG